MITLIAAFVVLGLLAHIACKYAGLGCNPRPRRCRCDERQNW